MIPVRTMTGDTMFNTPRLSLLIALTLFAGHSAAQQIDAILNKKSANWDVDFRVYNNTAVPFKSVVLDITNTPAIIDWADLGQSGGASVVPDMGNNNDGKSAQRLTLTPNSWILPGQSYYTIMDIDGGVPSANQATLTATDTQGRLYSGRFVDSGADQWTLRFDDISVVTPPAPVINGQATANISWTAPTKRENGETLGLTEIGGYLLFFGNQSRNGRCASVPTSKGDKSCYSSVQEIAPSGAQGARVLNHALSADTTIYYAMSTFDSDGQISAYSPEVSKSFTIAVVEPTPPPPPTPEPPTAPQFNIQIVTDCEVVGDQVKTCSISFN